MVLGIFGLALKYLRLTTVHGKCTHIFHMHCLLKWIESAAAKGLCPMDRRPWGESFRVEVVVAVRDFFWADTLVMLPETADR